MGGPGLVLTFFHKYSGCENYRGSLATASTLMNAACLNVAGIYNVLKKFVSG